MWFWLQTTVLSLLLSSIYPKWCTQNIEEDFINISCVWKRTQGNFCDQHTVLGTKMPYCPFLVTWLQWLAESVPTLMENLCRCSQDVNTHLWVQGGVLGTGRLRYSWCQAGGGGESLSQHKLLSLNSWQDTRHFSKGKIHQAMNRRGLESGVRAALETMPCVICAVLSSSQRFSATMQVCVYVCYNIPNMKFTVPAILST